MKCFVLAGGSGDALWPLSRKNDPKQFIYLNQGRSPFQETIARNLPFCDEFVIITNKKYHYIVEGQLQVFQGLSYHCMLEEVSRQTAPAIAIATMCCKKEDEILVVSTDHVIYDGDYVNTILCGQRLLKEKKIVAIGVKEREDKGQAGHQYFQNEADVITDFSYSNGSCVDSGIFLTKASTFMELLAEGNNSLYKACLEGSNRISMKGNTITFNENWYGKLPSISVGEAIYKPLSKNSQLGIVIGEFHWMRLLDLEHVYYFSKEEKESYAIQSNCSDVSVINEVADNLIVCNRLEDIVVVNTKDATFISKKGYSSEIKTIMQQNYESYKDFFNEGDIYYTSWGIKETLNRSEGYMVKKLTVFPGKSLTMHKHQKRSEHWSIVSGCATISMNGQTKEYGINQSVYVPAYTYHQIRNETAKDLIVIEVSIGESVSYVNEDILDKNEGIVKLSPYFKNYLWGGHAMEERFNKSNRGDVIAESWEVSTHKAGQSIVATGTYKGKTLLEYIESIGKSALGWKCQPFEQFPLLVKFIDANKRLSIQVHPDDAYAMEYEHEYGKNEMWYIIDAKEEAFVYLGFRETITKEECSRRIEEGTILEVLKRVPVKTGDVIFVEAGMIHAINEGILILEIQQNSNATYRFYDYERVDQNGEKRELHIEKALKNITLEKREVETKPEGELIEGKGFRKQLLGQCKYFQSTFYDVNEQCEISFDDSTFYVIVIIEGNGKIHSRNVELNLFQGDTFFLSAGKKTIRIEGVCKFILTHI